MVLRLVYFWQKWHLELKNERTSSAKDDIQSPAVVYSGEGLEPIQ